MIFKKKYKRSEWMEGLLWAESLRKLGWQDDTIYQKVPGSEQRVVYNEIGRDFKEWKLPATNFARGVWDYLDFHRKRVI